jgi:hypothetical protein
VCPSLPVLLFPLRLFFSSSPSSARCAFFMSMRKKITNAGYCFLKKMRPCRWFLYSLVEASAQSPCDAVYLEIQFKFLFPAGCLSYTQRCQSLHLSPRSFTNLPSPVKF